jgi:hypothetical protein
MCHPKHNIPIFVYFSNINMANSFMLEGKLHKQSQQEIQTNALDTTDTSINSKTWSDWLNNILTNSEMPPDGLDIMDAITEAYGGKNINNSNLKCLVLQVRQ